MNPVGRPFESFDHLGRFRVAEPVLDKDATAKNVGKKGRPLGDVRREVPVDATGRLADTGNPCVEGGVANAVAMLRRLADSERVEQTFVHHAFRYWLGRNETLGDGPSLHAIRQAYKESGGSFKALLTALLTSNAFLYRVPSVERAHKRCLTSPKRHRILRR